MAIAIFSSFDFECIVDIVAYPPNQSRGLEYILYRKNISRFLIMFNSISAAFVFRVPVIFIIKYETFVLYSPIVFQKITTPVVV